MSGIGARAGGAAFSQREVLAEAVVPLLSPFSTEPFRWAPYHLPGSHRSSLPDDSLRSCSIQLLVPPNPFPVAFPYEWPVLALASNFPKISQESSIWPQCAPYPLLSGHRPGTSGSHHWFTAWPLLGTSKPSTSSSHLQTALQPMPGSLRQNAGSG